MEQPTDETRIVTRVMQYLYNVDPYDFIRMLFPAEKYPGNYPLQMMDKFIDDRYGFFLQVDTTIKNFIIKTAIESGEPIL